MLFLVLPENESWLVCLAAVEYIISVVWSVFGILTSLWPHGFRSMLFCHCGMASRWGLFRNSLLWIFRILTPRLRAAFLVGVFGLEG
jgi:hypothetical protein